MAQKQTYVPPKKEVYQSFGSKINAASMDDRFLIVGMEDGTVECVYTHGGTKAPTRNWAVSISSAPITAVLADSFDAGNDPLFYAGDKNGILYCINQKGKVISQSQVRDGPIFAILDKNIKEVVAYSEGGQSHCKLTNNQLAKVRSKASKFSFDNDAAFYTKREKGDMPAEIFRCEVPSSVIGTTRLQLEWDDEKSFMFMEAFATLSKRFRDLVDNMEAPETLDIVDRNQRKIRTLEFISPVRQVINAFVQKEDMRKDALYVLLWNDQIIRFVASELLDESKTDKDLTQTLIYNDDNEDKNMDNNDGDIRLFVAKLNKVVFVTGTEENLLYVINDA